MLDMDVTDAAARLVDGEMAARQTGLAQALLTTQSDLHRRGLLGSGNAVYAYADAGKEELRQIAASLWTALSRSLAAMPPQVGPSLRGDVDQAFASMFDERYRRVMAALAPKFASISTGSTHGPASVRPTYDALVQKYSGEIALWVAAQQRARVPVAGAPAPSYTFHGPVGSIQTGANATSHVVQNIGATDAASLLNAVRQLAQELSAMRLQPETEGEGLRLSAALERELAEAHPSGRILKGLFIGLATFIQTLGSAPAAYAVLESMAMSMHLM